MWYAFASNNWSIWWLFSNTNSYSSFSTIWNKITIGWVKTNEIKLGNNWTIKESWTDLQFSNGTNTITLWSDWSVKSNEYKYN